MPSCTLQHSNYVHRPVGDENSGLRISEMNHKLLPYSRFSNFDNPRAFNGGKNNISRSYTPNRIYDLNRDLNRSAVMNFRKTDVLTLKPDVSVGSMKRSHTFSSAFNTVIDTSPKGNSAKFGDKMESAGPDVRHCHDCLEEEDGGVPRRAKRSVMLLPGTPIHVETAVFIDKDLYQHMALNFPADTERELVRVVLAMINAVSLSHNCNYFSICRRFRKIATSGLPLDDFDKIDS